MPTEIKAPCKRCRARADKVLGKRRRRTYKLADGEAGILRYKCDVGLKSLLRSICDFYQSSLHKFSEAKTDKKAPHTVEGKWDKELML